MKKIRITPSNAGRFKNAPKSHVIYECGYFVRDPEDGWTYIVDFPTLLMGEYETIFPVYWEKVEEVEKYAA